MIPPPRANLFDASALVKVYAMEPGSRHVRDYFLSRSPTKYTTPFCFYEALNILKSKWKYGGKLTEGQYRQAASDLITWYARASATRYMDDLDLTKPEVQKAVREIVEKYSLDYSDALQVVSVKSGLFSHMANANQTILVTADRELAAVARAEGVRAWDVLTEPEP